MINSFKTKLWELLERKEVSLAMLFNRDGNILWHKGRKISGKSVSQGIGFSKSYIRDITFNQNMVDQDNIIVETVNGSVSQSAADLLIKSLIIIYVGNDIFLYIDSGVKEHFTDCDKDVFKILGEMLGEIINQIKKSETDIGGITGTSEKIEEVRHLVLKYSLEDNPVLLLGETGSGKSHIAELIHHYSGRKGRFFTINTPGIPRNLFESEIFGHKKGAFTDAKTDKEGYVGEAEGGTLFFDEISEVPPAFQAKLLRFIETKKYTQLGDARERRADVRILAATNTNLAEAIRRHQFRKDLYYRLQILEIQIPPLRERKEDIRELVREKRHLLKGKKTHDSFWAELLRHDWPGNVRELYTILTRAGIHSEGIISGGDIRKIISQAGNLEGVTAGTETGHRIQKELQQGRSFWEAAWQPFLDRDIDRESIKQIINQALQKSDNNFKRMIEKLNIKPAEYHKFMSLMHRYKIDPRC